MSRTETTAAGTEAAETTGAGIGRAATTGAETTRAGTTAVGTESAEIGTVETGAVETGSAETGTVETGAVETGRAGRTGVETTMAEAPVPLPVRPPAAPQAADAHDTEPVGEFSAPLTPTNIVPTDTTPTVEPRATTPLPPPLATASPAPATSTKPATALPPAGLSPSLALPRPRGLLASEMRYVFRRPRTYAMLGFLAFVPVLLGVALRWFTDGVSGENDEGSLEFVSQVTNNGLFLVFASLAATLPFFLPMTVGVVSGDAIAGEAHGGTLRYLLVAPAGRVRLLLVKYAGIVAFCFAATFTVALSALAVGAVLFPMGDVPLLNGDSIPMSEALLRALAIAAVVSVSLLGIAAVGLFVSTLTAVPVAAMATTVGLVIVAAILTSIPQFHALHPWLFTDEWLSYGDLLRDPVVTGGIVRNLELQLAYTAVFGAAAWARMSDRDVTC